MSLSIGVKQAVILCAVFGLAAVARADDAKASAVPDKLAPLTRFVGEWVIDGHWASGEPLRARTVYEYGIAKKNIHTRTFVKNGDSEYQRYEGVFAFHPQKKCLVHYNFAYNGDVTESVVDVVDATTFHVGWTPFDGKPSNLRQVLRFTDEDSFVWTVFLKKGDGWDQLIEATWHRKAH
jgi:hypothetical protein